MIIKVKIDEQIYEVEINDVRVRPIKALVEGEEFEIWPEGEPTVHPILPIIGGNKKPNPSISTEDLPRTAASSHAHIAKPNVSDFTPSGNGILQVVRAPIPGVITAVNTQTGAEVTVGQQLCVLEAMKMNNLIRAPRAGRISAVHISVGQHVKHHDILVEYAD
jgi:glutaconyl-CoA/methylmalonyl-CoA decarboxylase subunit gamma